MLPIILPAAPFARFARRYFRLDGVRLTIALATGIAPPALAGLYASGTTSAQTTEFGAQFAGDALSLRILVPGVGVGQRNASATFLNSGFAIGAKHTYSDLVQYSPSFEVADGTNYLNNRGNVRKIARIIEHPNLDLVIFQFESPFYASENKAIGTAATGELTFSAGFGQWGTPATGLSTTRDGSLRAWDANVSSSVFGASAPTYQSTRFGRENAGTTLNARAANFDSGGPVFNRLGELIGINEIASTSIGETGTTTFLRLGEPSIKTWIEANTALPPPVLAMIPSAGGTAMRLTWDADAIGYRLQTSDILSGWTNQGSVLTGPGTMDDPIGNSTQRFYRLAKP